MPPLEPADRSDRRPSARPRTRRERAALAFLLAALAWTAYGLVVETVRWREGVADRAAGADPAAGVVAAWQPGDPGPRRLERFLAVVAGYLPPGARVALVAPQGPASREHFVALWTAYLLPGQRVLPRAGALDALDGVDYVVAWEAPVDDPRLVPLLYHPDGAVYRVAR